MAYFPNSRQDYHGIMTPFYMEPAKKDVMGYRLTNVEAGDVIMPGTPIKTDEKGKTAVICKYAYVLAVAIDKKTLTVKGGHHLKAGDKVAISGASTLTQLTISAVDNDADTITLSAANNSIKAEDVLVEVATTGTGQEAVVAPVALPNRIVDTVAKIDALDKTCSATHEVVVLQNVVHYPDEYLNKTAFPGSILLVGDPKILFVIQ